MGRLSQVGADKSYLSQLRICDFLGVKDILLALSRVRDGYCALSDFDLIGDNWLLKEEIEQQLLAMELPTDPFLPGDVLSSGQLTRLTLHKLLRSGYRYLIRDEPGNHLDMESRKLLAQALNDLPAAFLSSVTIKILLMTSI